MTYVIGVDTGGTFTDAFLADETGRVMAAKTASTPPDFARGFLTAIGDLAAALGGSAEQMLAQTSYIVHGTTSTLNSIVTGDVAPVGFLTTRGHADSIAIMNLEGRYAGLGSDQVQHMARTNSRPRWCPGTGSSRSMSASTTRAWSSSVLTRTACGQRCAACWRAAWRPSRCRCCGRSATRRTSGGSGRSSMRRPPASTWRCPAT